MLSERCRLMIHLGILCGVAVCAGRQVHAQQEQADPAKQNSPAKLKTLNDHFPFHVPESTAGWDERSERLRERVLVATGLWPMPDKTPLQPVLHGKIRREGFTVEKVYFQSMPGHFVTGMLFRPTPDNQLGVIDGRRPAILSPHGHGGRTMRLDDSALEKQLKSGGEIYEQSGRFPKLARCAHLARMGCVTFIFDMLGYADSQQIDRTTAHRHAKPRPEEADRDKPCLYSIDADLNLQSVMGLQTWNALRCLDFLVGLPDVDADRLGVTGGSGGGTQTILLGAIDPRIKVGFPNGMVSTSMQGGCYCENCNYLRIGTGNVELAALFAPKPQGMTAAEDWTRDMLNDGFPELQKLYQMLGVSDLVMCGDVLQFPHNYNYVTRSMMYPWMAKHLGLPAETPLVEKDFKAFSDEEMKVWDDQHPAPAESGVPHEQRLLAWWKEQSERKVRSWIPSNDNSGSLSDQWDVYRRQMTPAWRVMFDRDLPELGELVVEQLNQDALDGEVLSYRLEHPGWGTRVRIDVSARASEGTGKDASPHFTLVARNSNQQPPKLDASGTRRVDVFVTPAMIQDGRERQHLVEDQRSYSGFTFGYNRPLVVKRFEQLLCALAFLRGTEDECRIDLMADQKSCVSAAAAGAMAGEAIDRLRLDTGGSRLGNVTTYADAMFLPGADKYFDLPGLLSLRAPHSLELTGESAESIGLVRQIYRAAGAEDQLRLR